MSGTATDVPEGTPEAVPKLTPSSNRHPLLCERGGGRLSNERGVGPLAATVLVAGNMIGSGVFMLPASLAATGSSTIIAWIISSAGALALAGVFAALATIRPTQDAIVDYPARGLHPFFGFANWWLYLLACWIGVPAVALAATGYLAYFLPVLAQPLAGAWTTIALIWLLTVANIFGAKLVTRLGGLTLLIGLAPIVVATVLGIAAFDVLYYGPASLGGPFAGFAGALMFL